MAAPTTSMETAAQACIDSYVTAMALAQTSTSLPLIAAKLAEHYLPQFTAFSLGHIQAFPTKTTSQAMIQSHLEHLVKCGLGCDVRKVSSRVQVLSEGEHKDGGSGSVLCWIKWKIVPGEGWKGGADGKGKGGWEWENCYFFRKMWSENKGWEEGWEGVISDSEIKGLVEHVPRFFG